MKITKQQKEALLGISPPIDPPISPCISEPPKVSPPQPWFWNLLNNLNNNESQRKNKKK